MTAHQLFVMQGSQEVMGVSIKLMSTVIYWFQCHQKIYPPIINRIYTLVIVFNVKFFVSRQITTTRSLPKLAQTPTENQPNTEGWTECLNYNISFLEEDVQIRKKALFAIKAHKTTRKGAGYLRVLRCVLGLAQNREVVIN